MSPAVPRARRLAGIGLCLLLGACASMGPQSIPRDRLAYSSAVGESWKEQTLLNIVRLRYADAPMFLDVSSIVASYSAEAQLDGTISFPATGSAVAGAGGHGRFTSKPTVSYSPLTGDKFARSLLRPIPPTSVLQMIQAGYPADFILLATTRAINGRYNRSAGIHARHADPDFLALAAVLRRIQQSEGLGMRIEQRGDGEATVLFFRDEANPPLQADVAAALALLGIRKSSEFDVVYGAVKRNDKEIAILTRSMLEILLDFSNCIEVPPEHIHAGRTYAGHEAEPGAVRRLATIHSGAQAPADAFAAVAYRGSWYWIDDHDMDSKRAFAFMMMFFSLAETGTPAAAPVLTIGAD